MRTDTVKRLEKLKMYNAKQRAVETDERIDTKNCKNLETMMLKEELKKALTKNRKGLKEKVTPKTVNFFPSPITSSH